MRSLALTAALHQRPGQAVMDVDLTVEEWGAWGTPPVWFSGPRGGLTTQEGGKQGLRCAFEQDF